MLIMFEIDIGQDILYLLPRVKGQLPAARIRNAFFPFIAIVIFFGYIYKTSTAGIGFESFMHNISFDGFSFLPGQQNVILCFLNLDKKRMGEFRGVVEAYQ